MESGEEKKENCENCKRGGGKLKMEGGKVRNEERTIFFFFFFFFCFSLFKTTICFGSTEMEISCREKAFFLRREKNQEK